MPLDIKEVERLKAKDKYTYTDLCDIMRLLRADGGCPWDREQTHKSIRNNFIEETYEVIEAIDTDNKTLLCEELGDVLLQVVFHAEIEKESGSFGMDEIADGICKKLVLRHPHIFADVDVKTTEGVLSNWEKIKNEEKHRDTPAESMRSVPPMLPALMRADKIGKKGRKYGMDFTDSADAMKKVYEEAREFEEASDACAEEELGDLLLSVVNVARLRGIDSERALNSATDKFIDRFEKAHNEAVKDGKDMLKMTPEELDGYWKRAKSTKKPVK